MKQSLRTMDAFFECFLIIVRTIKRLWHVHNLNQWSYKSPPCDLDYYHAPLKVRGLEGQSPWRRKWNTKTKKIEKIASDLGVKNVDALCDGVRDILELYKNDIKNDLNATCKEVENIDIARRTILEIQDEL